MTVTTHKNVAGETVVKLQGGMTHKINLYFKTREDALALLKALRKRIR